MWSGAFLAPFIFVVALPDDFLVLICVVPDLRTVPAAALAAFNLAGEVTDAAVAVSSRTAFLQLDLHLIEDRRVDDCLMVAFHVVLRDLALVDLSLLGKVIDGVGFL